LHATSTRALHLPFEGAQFQTKGYLYRNPEPFDPIPSTALTIASICDQDIPSKDQDKKQ
jgi:hypothetical protein